MNPELAEARDEPGRPSAWGLLLDRLEHRVRLLEAAARPTGSPVDVGPAAGADDVPSELPTVDERLRMLALVATHDQVIEQLQRRRVALRQAQHYRMGAV